jgi:hypothetical protein
MNKKDLIDKFIGEQVFVGITNVEDIFYTKSWGIWDGDDYDFAFGLTRRNVLTINKRYSNKLETMFSLTIDETSRYISNWIENNYNVGFQDIRITPSYTYY